MSPATQKLHTLAMPLRALLGFNVLFLVVNGALMLVAPKPWYELVPGVVDTGFFNAHFVRDIGIIQMFLGVLFVLGVKITAARFELWAAATLWLTAHAALHIWEVAVGICGASTLLRDFPAVTLPALIGMVLSWHAWRLRH
jgi:uncharacterized protein YjeT (DUF2065 family)